MAQMRPFVDLLVIALPSILSIVGVLVSIEAPAIQTRTRWKVGMLASGVLLTCLTAWQQSLTRQDESEAKAGSGRLENDLRKSLTDTGKQLENVKGQLTALAFMYSNSRGVASAASPQKADKETLKSRTLMLLEKVLCSFRS